MKIVIIDPNSTMIPQMGVMIDEALIAKSKGHEITYITCGNCLDSCYSNPFKNNLFCKICISDYKSNLSKHLGDQISHRTLNDFSSNRIEEEVRNFDTDFDSIEDLKKKFFKGIDVGYASLSAFISNTRNMSPELTNFSMKLFKKKLRAAVRMSLLCEEIHRREKPDKIILYNGRMPESRPVLRYFRKQGIDVDILEVYPTNLSGGFKKITYHNALPHSIENLQKIFNQQWDKDPEKAEKLGIKFFENRRNADFAGDKVYTANQRAGLLPKSWNKSSRNISIFNSSEDEFAAIGNEWEDKLFPTQLKGIQYIFSCIDKYPNAEIYLRVHPNLKKIKYKYHTDLYRLASHPRIHVIPASSEVSTYALVDASDVIVSFGTSVGVEAAYSDKPVVLLGTTAYKGLGFCHEPKNLEEMEQNLFVDKLVPLKNNNILKYGNFIMTDKGKDFTHYNFNCTQFKLGKLRTPNVAMIGQSQNSFGTIKSFCMRVWRELQRRYLKFRIKEV